jgi:hypothetical protein
MFEIERGHDLRLVVICICEAKRVRFAQMRPPLASPVKNVYVLLNQFDAYIRKMFVHTFSAKS